jgi:hypothetical protein
MKRAVLLLTVLSASPIALGQLYTTVTLSGDRTQLASTGHAEYRSGTSFTIDHDWYVGITDSIDGPKSSSANSSDWGTVTVNNAVLQPPPFLGSGLPAGCYRATVSATAQLPNTPNFVSQGVGSSQTCFTDPPPPPPPPPDPDPSPGGGCIDNCDGGTQNATGAGSEPLLINFSGPYKLSGLDDPVVFDINATAQAKTIGWTARGSDEAFLAFDRNGNGQIDDGSELFGNATLLTQGGRAQNGFEALAQYDTNGDGVINASDPIWSALLLWVDANHNGVSDPSELRRISGSTITAIETGYHWSGRRDQFGNRFGFEGQLHEGKRSKAFYDVFFVTAK